MSFDAVKVTCIACRAVAFENPYVPHRFGRCPSCWDKLSRGERRRIERDENHRVLGEPSRESVIPMPVISAVSRAEHDAALKQARAKAFADAAHLARERGRELRMNGMIFRADEADLIAEVLEGRARS